MKKKLTSVKLLICAMVLSVEFGAGKSVNASYAPRNFTGFVDQIAPAPQDGKFGYIDKSGKFVIPPKFKLASSFSEGLAAVFVDGRWGYIDRAGVMVIMPRFQNAGAFSSGAARVSFPERSGYIDKTGKFINPEHATDNGYSWDFSEGLAPIGINQKGSLYSISYMDLGGKVVVPKGTSRNSSQPGNYNFSEGMAAVCYDNDCGFINHYGSMVIDAQFCNPDGFSEGVAFAARKRNKECESGYIDKTGKTVISGEFDLGMPFSEGLALVRYKTPLLEKAYRYAYIDKKGNKIFELDDKLDPGRVNGLYKINDNGRGPGYFANGRALVQQNENYGYIDQSGKLLIPAVFDVAHPFSEGLAMVYRGDKMEYIDDQGNTVWREGMGPIPKYSAAVPVRTSPLWQGGAVMLAAAGVTTFIMCRISAKVPK